MDFKERNFLFLQGLATPFLDELGSYLRKRSARTLRVNFCPGDEFYWHGPSIKFSKKQEELPVFYENLFEERGFSDVVLFGDTRALHRPAMEIANRRRVRVHVFEEGYLRPYWITLERGGVNANSPLPRNPDWYIAARKQLHPPPAALEERTNPTVRVLQDMAFHMANLSAPLFYPRYRSHRPRHPALEYAGWAQRMPTIPLRRRTDERKFREVSAGTAPVFFFPLQLSGDSQITRHSPFSSIAEAIEFVMRSFAFNAPADARLIIKNHPLDTGLDRHGAHVEQLAKNLHLQKRVFFFETGHLPTISERAQGTVVVNSTVGISALGHGCPVKTLADPIYNLPGLTFQGKLDDFWANATPPDPSLYRAFRDVLLATTQVNGNFFTREGIRLAVKGCDRMLAEESPLMDLKKRVSGQ